MKQRSLEQLSIEQYLLESKLVVGSLTGKHALKRLFDFTCIFP